MFPDARLVRTSIPPRLIEGELDFAMSAAHNEAIQANIAIINETENPWEYLDLETVPVLTYSDELHPDANGHTQIANALIALLSEDDSETPETPVDPASDPLPD